jgi:hypothetical protein
MNSKRWFESKLFWIGTLQVLIGVGTSLAEFFSAGVFDAASITLFITGVLTIISRTFFTDTVIQ